MATKTVKTEIALAVREGYAPLTAQAEIYSGLGLHRIQYGWAITHVTSGVRIAQVIGVKAEALTLLAKLIPVAQWETFGRAGKRGDDFVIEGMTKEQEREVNRVLLEGYRAEQAAKHEPPAQEEKAK